MPDFRKALADDKIYFFDGGYGTLLQSRGMPAGISPELYGLQEPEAIAQVHADYIAAGANILTTNTFGGSRFKLGLDADVKTLNCKMAQLARRVAGDNAFVAGSVGPVGHFVEPLGELTFRELVEAFREQIEGLVEGGIDLIMAETHFDLAEVKALVIAARQVCDLPIITSMTFEDGNCLTGTSPLTFLDTMQNMGVDVVGTNCSAGPEQILDVTAAMQPRLEVPLIVEANAGLPELDENGNTIFRLDPESFAKHSVKFLDHGAKIIGGCCGTTPAHIKALREACEGRKWTLPEKTDKACMVLTSRSTSVPIGFEHPGVIIGERINPTGKPKLIEELQAGDFTEALRFAKEQSQQGAPVLDVNVGAPMVDEVKILPELVKTINSRYGNPLSIDSTDPDAVEAALWAYPGSPLVNSISGEPGRMEKLGPLCKLFGAPFILLPIKGKKLPFTPAERIAVIEGLLEEAESYGIPRRLIMVDALALTVSSKPEAAQYCFETIRYCKEKLGLPTTLGLSNVSFGLPARELVNSTFLSMCMVQGMCSFIANPNSARLQQSLKSAEVLLNRDPQAQDYITRYADFNPNSGSEQGGVSGGTGGKKNQVENLFDAVVHGAKEDILGIVEAQLAEGVDPFVLVNEHLIPGIIEVGERYERKEFFLPQLLLSAETLQKAIARIEPLLKEGGAAAKETVIMATVEGDIHDIGKNIVCLMLQNQGFDVIDLGKDVTAEKIVAAAVEHKAKIIGLSALMTTTMVRMEDTVKLIKEKGLNIKVMVGGAVVTQDFADNIGADGYSPDAVSCVKLASRLIQ
ncbi:MAG: homocysteine S-methyltransferase family protein [Desulfovibrio sp.]